MPFGNSENQIVQGRNNFEKKAGGIIPEGEKAEKEKEDKQDTQLPAPGEEKSENKQPDSEQSSAEEPKPSTDSNEKEKKQRRQRKEQPVETPERVAETSEQNNDNKKAPESKSVKTVQKSTRAYYKNYYNLRVDLPKEAEEFLDIAAKIYGSRRDYIEKLILADMKENLNEYREKIASEKSTNKWTL